MREELGRDREREEGGEKGEGGPSNMRYPFIERKSISASLVV